MSRVRGHVTEASLTLLLSALSCLNCNGPSLVASQKPSDEESPLEPESSDERSTWRTGRCDARRELCYPISMIYSRSCFAWCFCISLGRVLETSR